MTPRLSSPISLSGEAWDFNASEKDSNETEEISWLEISTYLDEKNILMMNPVKILSATTPTSVSPVGADETFGRERVKKEGKVREMHGYDYKIPTKSSIYTFFTL
jgi:hypothetical protein